MGASAQAIADREHALTLLKDLVRRRYGLGNEQFVSVSEFTCHVPDCPPKETLIMFWLLDRTRTVLKIHKGLAEIVEVDLANQDHTK